MMYQREINSEEVDGLELLQYEGPICMIESSEQFREEAGRISSEAVIGFDTETRPSFKKGVVFPTSLVQLAHSGMTWLIRVGRMGYPAGLLELLSDKNIIKIGSGLNDDLRRLQVDFKFRPAGFLDLQDYVTAFRIEEKGLRKLSAIVLGKRISKSQQVSNWDADELTEAQLRYAATDAWICLEIYNKLRNSLPGSHG